MNHFRKPRSVHSQIECVLHGIEAYGKSKKECPDSIRSYGTRKVYSYEAHKFGDSLILEGFHDIFDSGFFFIGMDSYLYWSFEYFKTKKLSLQTLETRLAALGKLEHAINTFADRHNLSHPKVCTQDIRKKILKKARDKETGIPKSSKHFNRAFPEPLLLIWSINNPTHSLQASLQYEGGLRTEGVGAASNGLANPITVANLGGLIPDPVTGKDVGLVCNVREKGGKLTDHMVTPETYQDLVDYIKQNKALESPYEEYLSSIKEAAMLTGQYSPGRGTHGLKHSFAQRRYTECISHGFTHEQALQQTSLELAHFRYYETYTYTTR